MFAIQNSENPLKKQLIIPGMAILLLAVALSGCTAPSNGFDSTSTFKLLSCLYYPDENKVLISINRSSSDSFTCRIVDSEGSIGFGYINEVEEATYIELDEIISYTVTYGLIINQDYIPDDIIFSIGLQFSRNGTVKLISDWNLPESSTFKLISWEQIFDEEAFYLGLSINFEYSKSFQFYILDSEGIEVADKRVDFFESKAIMHFRENTFNPLLFDQDLQLIAAKGYGSNIEKLYEEKIRLKGNISLFIIDAEFNWEEYKPWFSEEIKYRLNEFNFTIKNDGDLPIYSGLYIYGNRLPKIGTYGALRVIFLGEEYNFDIGHVLSSNKINSFGLIEIDKEITTNVYLGTYNHKIIVDSPGDYDITITLDYYDTSTSLTTTTAVG